MALTREGPEIIQHLVLALKPPTFFLGFAISWSLSIFGEPFPGSASSPVSSYSQAHRHSVESFMPSSSDRSLTVISPDRTAFAAETLNCLSYRFLPWVILNTFRS
mgnify:CR=1 FL=1